MYCSISTNYYNPSFEWYTNLQFQSILKFNGFVLDSCVFKKLHGHPPNAAINLRESNLIALQQ